MPGVQSLRIAGVLLALLAWLLPPEAACAQRHSFTVEDMLGLENLDEARISPDGRWLVYVRVPAMRGRANQGATVDAGLHTGEIRLVALDRSEPSRPLFAHGPETSYWLGDFSPDGRRLLVYSVKGVEARLGAYDFGTRRLVEFPGTPAFDDRQDYSPVWISNETVVFPSLTGGLQPYGVNGRPYMAALLQREWEKTWRGEQPAVVVSESRVDGGGNRPKQGRLLRVDARDGSSSVLADGLFADLRLSADRRFLAALKQYVRPQPAADRLFADWTSSRTQLQVFGLESGQGRVIAEELDVGNASLEWSPTAGKLAFFAWKRGAEVQSGLFHSYDVVSGRVTPWPHHGLDLVSERERGYIQRPERAAWLGDRIAVPARRQPAGSDGAPRFSYRGMTGRDSADPGRADWFALSPDGSSTVLTAQFEKVSMLPVSASADGLFVLADGHLWRIAENGQRVDLTPEVEGELAPAFNARMSRPPYSGPVALVADSDYWLVDMNGARPPLHVEGGDDTTIPLVASLAADSVVLRRDTDTSVDLVQHKAGQAPRLLQRLNPQLAEIAIGQWHVVEYQAKGHALKACLLAPPGYEAGRRYPVIVDLYPGTRASCARPESRRYYGISRQVGFNFDELLAGQGYLVFKAATPSELIRTEQGPVADMVSLVEAGVDALIEQGYADPERIGVFGLSQGGISSLWLATQSNRFDAIVSVNGWSDLAGHYLSSGYQEMLLPEQFPYALHASRYEGIAGSDFGLGKTLWQDPDLYLRNGALLHADQVKTPLLMIHSDMDIFPMQQYDAMFSALYRLRKPAQYVRYLGEGHSPSSAANVHDMWTRIFDWYEQYMPPAGGEAAADRARVNAPSRP